MALLIPASAFSACIDKKKQNETNGYFLLKRLEDSLYSFFFQIAPKEKEEPKIHCANSPVTAPNQNNSCHATAKKALTGQRQLAHTKGGRGRGKN